MTLETFQKAKELIDALRLGDHIDDMTNLTPNPSQIPRNPVFYTLTKIHKPKPVGRLSYQAAKSLSLNFLSLPIGVVFGLSTPRNIITSVEKARRQLFRLCCRS